jgi:hypothetical protein
MRFVIVDDDEVLYHCPLAPEKTKALEDLLRQAQCFSPSFTDIDPYSIETYIVQLARHGIETTFLIDRNIYSQILTLAKGTAITEKTRVAAGIMAFASCANVGLEPSLALYEGSASGARGGWKNDLGLFHRGDDIHPGNWAALAVGDAQRFAGRISPRRLRAEISQRFDPAIKLKSFEFVYPILLKMALMSRTAASCDSKMIALLEWMYDSWHFSAPATVLGSLVLSQDPPRKVFKNIGSPDRRRALKGVKNAAWDLVYITEWYKKIKAQVSTNKLTVICSRDRMLLRVAELLRKSLFEEGETSFLRQAGFGNLVQDKYAFCVSNLENSSRALVPFPDNFQIYRKRLVSKLEVELLRPEA